MLQAETTDRRLFWWVLAILSAFAGGVTWNVLGAFS